MTPGVDIFYLFSITVNKFRAAGEGISLEFGFPGEGDGFQLGTPVKGGIPDTGNAGRYG
jgi:hypothetical protein